MQGSLDLPPIVIRSSRITAALMLLICAGFVAVGIWIVRDPGEDHVAAYLASAFSALGIPLFMWRLVRPDVLTLTPEGINWRSIFRTSSFRWDEVRDFRSYAPSGKTTTKHVGFDFTPSYRTRQGAFAHTARQLTGVDGSLGGGWELGVTDLADLLNNARARWLRSRRQQP
jgi:hypothetical protein